MRPAPKSEIAGCALSALAGMARVKFERDGLIAIRRWPRLHGRRNCSLRSAADLEPDARGGYGKLWHSNSPDLGTEGASYSRGLLPRQEAILRGSFNIASLQHVSRSRFCADARLCGRFHAPRPPLMAMLPVHRAGPIVLPSSAASQTRRSAGWADKHRHRA